MKIKTLLIIFCLSFALVNAQVEPVGINIFRTTLDEQSNELANIMGIPVEPSEDEVNVVEPTDDEKEESAEDDNKRITAVLDDKEDSGAAEPDKLEIDDEILVASERSDKDNNEIVMADTKEDGDPERPLVVGRVYNKEDDDAKKITPKPIIVGPSGEEIDFKKSGELVFAGKKITIEVKGSGDVIIKGKKIKENYYDDNGDYMDDQPPSGASDDNHKKWIDILAVSIKEKEDLTEYAVAVALNDENIEEITFTYGSIKVDYNHPAKLFGIINIDYTATTSVDEHGRIKVTFPWWVAISKSNAKEMKSEMEQELATIGDDAQLANTDLQNILQKQQQSLQMISNIAKMHHDTAMAIIRKIG